jgi:hypothetical protein
MSNGIVDLCIKQLSITSPLQDEYADDYSKAYRDGYVAAIEALGQLKKDPLTINKQG